MNLLQHLVDQFKKISKGEAALEIATTVGKDIITDGSGVGATADLADKAVRWVVQKRKEFRIDKEVKNLQLFIQSVSNRENELGVNFSQENFDALINKILSEDNEKKVYLYVNLAIRLSNRKDIVDYDKDNYIQMLSNLNMYDILTMRKYYIGSKNEFISNGNIPSQLRSIEQSNDLFIKTSINKIKSFGLLEDKKHNSKNIHYLNPTLLMQGFIELISDKNELTLESIGEEIYNNDIDVFIISFISNGSDWRELAIKNMNSFDFTGVIPNPDGPGLIEDTKGRQEIIDSAKNHYEFVTKLNSKINENYISIICSPYEFNSLKNKSKIFILVNEDDDTPMFNTMSTNSLGTGARAFMNEKNTINIYTRSKINGKYNDVRTHFNSDYECFISSDKDIELKILEAIDVMHKNLR